MPQWGSRGKRKFPQTHVPRAGEITNEDQFPSETEAHGVGIRRRSRGHTAHCHDRLGGQGLGAGPPTPIVEVATVEQRDVPVYGEWIGTLTGQVNADVKAQVTGYLLTRKYKESHHCPPACSSTPA